MTRPEPTASRGWLLDEVTCIGRENLDVAHVARYDEKEDAGAVDEVALLLEAGLLTTDATVVDLGAGTGQFALHAAQHCRRLVAVDPSPVMLDVLHANASDAPPSLEIVQAGFLTYEHKGEPADLVYSRYALHHLPDFWKAFALGRIRQMLRPGGTLRLWDVVYHFAIDEAEERIERWCGSVGDAAGEGEWVREELEEHVRDENSTFTWLLEPMLEQAGFVIQDSSYSDDGFFAKYMLVVPTPTAP